MVGRYGLCAFKRALKVYPEYRFSCLLNTNKMTIRNFKCSRNCATFSDGEMKLNLADKHNSNLVTGDKSVKVTDSEIDKSKFSPGSVLEYFHLSPSLQKCDEWKEKVINTMLVYPDFISPEEEGTLLKEIEPYISRLHYEDSHWDDAIHEYRETERSRWNKKNEVIIQRIRNLGFPPDVPQLKLVHILDLAKKGVIKPHIDSVRFCGNTIAGLSLLSDSIMRLRHEVQKDFFCDVLLPRYSLYIMKDIVRFEFTHEILGEGESIFKGKILPRDRRISVICRNEPDSSPGPVFKTLE